MYFRYYVTLCGKANLKPVHGATKGNIPAIVQQPINITSCFQLSTRRMENSIIPQEITAHRSAGERSIMLPAEEMARNWLHELDGMMINSEF
jgi:hypothetical protein